MRTVSGLTALTCSALLSLSVPASASASAAAPPTCFGQPATIVGTSGDDVLDGTPGPDVIVGLAGNDLLVGDEGDDLLCGGSGADTLVGGDDDDRLSGGRDLRKDITDDGDIVTFGDDLDGGAGDDELDPGWQSGQHELDGWVGDVIRFPGSTVGPQSGLDIDLAAGTAQGQGSDTLDLADADDSVKILASGQDDVIRGTDHADRIDAEGGHDQVFLRNGDDQVDESADSGDDTYVCGRGADVVGSENGSDVVDGGHGNDFLSATQRGTGRTTTVLGGAGNDTIAFFDRGTGAAQGSYSYRGGPGRDRFVPQVESRSPAPTQVDLGTHRVDVGADAAVFAGFEHLFAVSRHGAVDIAGTPARDQVSVIGAKVTADLGDGRDKLVVTDSGRADVQLGNGPDRLLMAAVRHGAVARLGPGDDFVASSILGRLGRQTLYGGAGQDRARLFGHPFVCHGIERISAPG